MLPEHCELSITLFSASELMEDKQATTLLLPQHNSQWEVTTPSQACNSGREQHIPCKIYTRGCTPPLISGWKYWSVTKAFPLSFFFRSNGSLPISESKQTIIVMQNEHIAFSCDNSSNMLTRSNKYYNFHVFNEA